MKNLALNIPSLNDATSFYRGAYPIAELRQRCTNFVSIGGKEWSEASIRMSDGTFFQRPFMSDHKLAIQMSQDVGRKVWVDYDDNLFEVPTDNPTYSKYSASECIETVKWILSNADIVTVSTQRLAEIYGAYNKNIRVVPNAIDMDLKSMKERGTPGARNKIMAWRGSRTHQRDVFTYASSIVNTSRDQKNMDWSWHFIGDNLWFLTDSMPHTRTFITRSIGPIEYHKHISALRPAAFIVPLCDSDFNRCKSNIAWIEATFAGAVAIAPDWPEWRHPGVLLYNNEAQFEEAMYHVMSGRVNVANTVATSWDYIQEHLTLSKVNEIRIDVLCELFDCTRKALGIE